MTAREWPRWYEWHKAWPYRRYWLPHLLGAAALAAVAVWFSVAEWGDRAVTRYFYQPQADHHWPFSQIPPWRQLNRYAGLGTAAIAVTALALIGISYARPGWQQYRIHIVYLLLVIAIGPGLLVNGLLKELWGRPRPRQVHEYGGWLPYRSILDPDKPGRGKSFPCGHCSASFAAIALYFLGRHRNRALAATGLLLVFVLGGGMSVSRVISGAHFTSDALMAAAVVWGVAVALYYFVLNIPAREETGNERAVAPGWPALAACGLLVVLIAVGGGLATPTGRTIWYDGRLTARGSDAPLAIRLEIEDADLTLAFGRYEYLAIRGFTEGFRGIGGSMKDILVWSPDRAGATQLTYRLWRRGLFADFRTTVTAHVPVAQATALLLDLRDVQLTLPDNPPPYPVDATIQGGSITVPPAWREHVNRFHLQEVERRDAD